MRWIVPRLEGLGQLARVGAGSGITLVPSSGDTWVSSWCSEHLGPGNPRAKCGLQQPGNFLFLSFLSWSGVSAERPIALLFGGLKFISIQHVFIGHFECSGAVLGVGELYRFSPLTAPGKEPSRWGVRLRYTPFHFKRVNRETVGPEEGSLAQIGASERTS